MKSGELLAFLHRLGYEEARTKGSHRRLTAPGRPPITFAFHPGVTIAPGMVRAILTKQACLTEDEIRELLSL